jgi:hypothetical protein
MNQFSKNYEEARVCINKYTFFAILATFLPLPWIGSYMIGKFKYVMLDSIFRSYDLSPSEETLKTLSTTSSEGSSYWESAKKLMIEKIVKPMAIVFSIAEMTQIFYSFLIHGNVILYLLENKMISMDLTEDEKIKIKSLIDELCADPDINIVEKLYSYLQENYNQFLDYSKITWKEYKKNSIGQFSIKNISKNIKPSLTNLFSKNKITKNLDNNDIQNEIPDSEENKNNIYKYLTDFFDFKTQHLWSEWFQKFNFFIDENIWNDQKLNNKIQEKLKIYNS